MSVVKSWWIKWGVLAAAVLLAWQPLVQTISEVNTWRVLVREMRLQAEQQKVQWACLVAPEEHPERTDALRQALDRYQAVSPGGGETIHKAAGAIYCQIGDYEAARRSFMQSLARSPQDEFSSLQILAIAGQSGDAAAANAALSSGNIKPSLLLQAADIHLRASRLPEALTWLGWAARLEPSQPGVWAGWLSAGGKYEAAQDYPAALRTYHQALAAQEQAGVSLYRGSLYLRVGRVLARQAETRPGAVHYFNWALAGGGFQSENERAQAHEARGGWYRAYRPAYAVGLYRADFEQALAINPKSAGALLNLGIVYLEDLKDPLAARAVFERGAALHPANASFPYYLGLAHKALGQRAAAQTAFERALELRPGWQSAETQLDLLRAAP